VSPRGRTGRPGEVRPGAARTRSSRRLTEDDWQAESSADVDSDTAEDDKAYRAVRSHEKARERFRQEQAAARAPDLTHLGQSLRDELKMVRKDPGWAVEKLARPGHIGTFPAPRKTGKTTFLANLARCGLDEEDFLGRFATSLEGNVAVVNAEMTRDDYLWTYRRAGIGNDDGLFIIHCLDDGIRLNLLSDVTCERFVKWLREREAEWLFLDPWKNLMSWSGVEINDNRGANDLLIRIQQIRSEAGLRLVIIPMNTPQNVTEGHERAKGAGEVEDGADVLWRYSQSDASDDLSPRILNCRGRGGISVSDIAITWDPDTDQLTAADGYAPRRDIRNKHRAKAAAEALELALIGGKRKALTAGEFDALIPGEKQDKLAVRAEAVRMELVIETAGKGNTKWYSVPED
jgi:hypothetical protein